MQYTVSGALAFLAKATLAALATHWYWLVFLFLLSVIERMSLEGESRHILKWWNRVMWFFGVISVLAIVLKLPFLSRFLLH